MTKLRFRQVHLDFHTSEQIPGVGASFDRRDWQEKLRAAHVDSITLFATCHHGWSYYPAKVGATHPSLGFNLLRAQMDACKEIGVNTPVYVTAGINHRISELHPEWREIKPDGSYHGWLSAPLGPGYMMLCYNTPYLDYVCELTAETVREFPDADGIFLDIATQSPCCCPACIKSMIAQGLDPECEKDRIVHARKVLHNYYRRTFEAVKSIAPGMPVFHNGGHVRIGDRDDLKYFTHLELESLPTADWGYDHYPMSAAYSRNLGLDFLGMTGKFHMAWGEFGTFKHPNALRYECAAMLANNSKCSIGDQLHPAAKLDSATYRLIGEAYREVEAKEPWCRDTVSAAATAILAIDETPDNLNGCTGAARALLECHIPFDLVDSGMDFSRYQLIVVAGSRPLAPETAAKLRAFHAGGGKVALSGDAILVEGSMEPVFDLGGEIGERSPFCPDFVEAAPEFVSIAETPFAMRLPGRRFKAGAGVSLGKVYDPYFNRDIRHFTSHQFAPYRPEPSGYDAGAIHDGVLYFAHPVFELYFLTGAVIAREFIGRALAALGERQVVASGLPSTGRVTLTRRAGEAAHILHVLYGSTVLRGGHGTLPNKQFPAKPVEVIEDLIPLRGASFSVKIPHEVRSVTLVPENRPLEFRRRAGRIEFAVDEFTCHAMIAIR